MSYQPHMETVLSKPIEVLFISGATYIKIRTVVKKIRDLMQYTKLQLVELTNSDAMSDEIELALYKAYQLKLPEETEPTRIHAATEHLSIEDLLEREIEVAPPSALDNVAAIFDESTGKVRLDPFGKPLKRSVLYTSFERIRADDPTLSYVTFEIFSAWVDGLRHGLTEEEITAFFQEIDVNNNGKIERLEFTQYFTRRTAFGDVLLSLLIASTYQNWNTLEVRCWLELNGLDEAAGIAERVGFMGEDLINCSQTTLNENNLGKFADQIMFLHNLLECGELITASFPSQMFRSETALSYLEELSLETETKSYVGSLLRTRSDRFAMCTNIGTDAGETIMEVQYAEELTSQKRHFRSLESVAVIGALE